MSRDGRFLLFLFAGVGKRILMVSLSWPLDYQLFTSQNRTLTVFAGRDFPRGAIFFLLATHSCVRLRACEKRCYYGNAATWRPTGNHVCLCSGEISVPREPITQFASTLSVLDSHSGSSWTINVADWLRPTGISLFTRCSHGQCTMGNILQV